MSETLSDFEGLFFEANIPTIHVKEFIKEFREELSGICNLRNNSELKMRTAVIKVILRFDKLVGEKLI